MNGLPWQPHPRLQTQTLSFEGGRLYLRDGGRPFAAQDKAVVVTGAFDGLTCAHHTLVKGALSDASQRGLPCVAVTFDPDPADLLAKDVQGLRLLATSDRISGLLQWGIDAVACLDFTQDVACLGPAAFLDGLLANAVTPVAVHVGSNFRFGHGGKGTVMTLRDMGLERHFEVRSRELVSQGNKTVSATRVRDLLRMGDLDEANALLERCHYVRGRVEHGRGEGTSFGFPTANVWMDHQACLPADGVYAGYVVRDSQAWPAAINVGAPPTFFKDDQPFLEANLLGFSGDLYDACVAVCFVKWLRSSRKFDSLQELEEVVLGNIDWVRQNLGEGMVEVRP